MSEGSAETTETLYAVERNVGNGLMARMLNEAAPGTMLTVVERTGMRCRIKFKRPGFDDKPVTIEVTLLKAVQMGVFDDPESRKWWTMFPDDMLYYAAVRRTASAGFPHVLSDGVTMSQAIESSVVKLPGQTLERTAE